MKKLYILLFTGFFLQMSFSQTSFNMSLIYTWTDTNITPVPGLNNQRFSDIWGYSQNGREYAIIGSTEGLHFFDVTDSTILDYIGFVAGQSHGSNIVHRDFKNYNNYLYAVSDEGPSSLQIIDLQYLPDSVHKVYDNDSLILRAHNVFVDSAVAKLYVFGPRTDMFSPGTPVGYPAMIFDISTPTAPQFLATFTHNIITYVHDGYIYNDTAIFNCGGDGLYYGYFGDTPNPVEIDVLPFYQDQGYNHSGWLTPDKQHYIMSDETHGMRMKMIDMQAGPNLLSTCDLIGSGVNAFSIAHNQIIRGNYLYVSYYFDGVWVFDISDPCNIQVAGWYDTFPGDAVDGGYDGNWGMYPLPSGKVLASDMHTGLYVLKFTPPVGMEEHPGFSFEMFPNPAVDFVQFNEAFENITIIDVHGKTVRYFKNQSVISVADLATGIYMIEVTKNGDRSYKKLIKE